MRTADAISTQVVFVHLFEMFDLPASRLASSLAVVYVVNFASPAALSI